MYLDAEKLKDNYIPEYIAVKFVNMTAGVVGLNARMPVRNTALVRAAMQRVQRINVVVFRRKQGGNIGIVTILLTHGAR